MQEDKFKISTSGLPDIEPEQTKRQEFLANGYRLYQIGDDWYAEKDGERIEIKEKKWISKS